MPHNAVVDNTASNEESPTPGKLTPGVVADERDASPTTRGRRVSESPAAKKVELDEFGLPMRKFKKPVLEEDSSEEETDYRRTWKYVRKRGESRSTSRDMLGSGAPTGQTPEKKSATLATDTPISSTSSRNSIYLEAQETVEPGVEQEESTDAPKSVQLEIKQEESTDAPKPVQPEVKQEDDKDVPKSTEPEVKQKDGTDVPVDPATTAPATSGPVDERPLAERLLFPRSPDPTNTTGFASEWSHQQVVPQKHNDQRDSKTEDEWQTMPAYAPYDIYDDDNKLIAREAVESDDEAAAYDGLGGAGKGYTRVNVDDDAQSATSMDENTKYLFKEPGTNVADEDDEQRNPLSQMQATKDLLTEGQRIAYVGVCRLAMVTMLKEVEDIKSAKNTKKEIGFAVEAMKMWSQKMMVRLYTHMDISPAEQIMIEQLAEHGVEPSDLTSALMHNSRVNNPMAEVSTSKPSSLASPRPESVISRSPRASPMPQGEDGFGAQPPPPYQEHEGDDLPAVRTPSQLPDTKKIDIDLRWTVLCDLFLVLIADSIYDSRSRVLLEKVGGFLNISWLEICKFEKRVTDALEMQEAAAKENWNEDEHMENRRKRAVKRKIIVMGLATVGGSLVIGLSAGLLAPVIGAGLAAGFTTIGVAGTSGFLAGAGGAALITSVAATSGGVIAVRASARRMGSVKTFEYRPLHNNKRVNLIITISGWMNGKVDDVRLPYSTVDPIMGDIYSVLWEPEMLQSMGQTINILATEALTQGLQQVLGSTVLVALMASLQLPIVLTKLSYLIDNPWTVSLDRANSAGLILADSLIDRNLGSRPITLVGYSLGARVIFSCLRELGSKGALGIIQNVYLFGAPIVAKKDEFLRARTVISGRFVNGYATNDWILGYLFRATSGGIMRVAGLAPVENIPGLENIDVTALVAGHMAYRAAMPRLLREVGWAVDSDEFAEIEDPDPDNHQARQRELINEIEEARKELEKEPKKKKFGFFGRNKKLVEKKEWETYDDNVKEGNFEENRRNSGVLFDIEAIRAELANQEIEVKEIKSTLPPMKLDLNAPYATGQLHTPYSNPRMSKSYDGSLLSQASNGAVTSSPSLRKGGPSYALDDNHDEYTYSYTRNEEQIRMEFEEPRRSLSPPASVPRAPSLNDSPQVGSTSTFARPELKSSVTMPASLSQAVEHNAWLDDEDYELGGEKEVTMSFE